MLVVVAIAAFLIVTVRFLLRDPLRAIEEAAIVEVMQRSSLPRNQLRASASSVGDEYHVFVLTLLRVQGGHCSLTFSMDGTLKEFEPGE